MERFLDKIAEKIEKIKSLLDFESFGLLKRSILNIIELNIHLTEKNKKYTADVGQVYYINLGFNIGAEMRGEHYCIVLAQHGRTATIIPLTSKFNEKTPKVNLGVIKEISKTPTQETYAVCSQITTVDKSRLSNKLKGDRYRIRIENEKLMEIKKEIEKFLFKEFPKID